MNTFVIEATVNHNVAHTWEYYFNQINLWWPLKYFTSERTKRFHIQTFVGGKAFEDFGEGDGLVWGEVIGVDYLKSLEIRGNLTRDFGGPAVTYEKYSFVQSENSTLLTYQVDFVGIVNEETTRAIQNTWKDLIGNHFKEYCDKRD